MKSTLPKYVLISLASFFSYASAQAQTSNCELVTMETISAAESIGAAKFHDASDFIARLYKGEDTLDKTVNGQPVRAVLCQRDSLLPTLRDLPLIKTGLPLSLSQDFDSPNSGLLMIMDTGESYAAEYTGKPEQGPDPKKLKDVMEIFNLQRLAK